jgi:hypothetical protein
MQPVLRILFFICFSFCACLSNAQGDEFFQIIHKPKDDAQVKAVFEKSNLKFKYGDTGYTHGDTYVSEAGYSRYYMYAIVDSTVRSITFPYRLVSHQPEPESPIQSFLEEKPPSAFGSLPATIGGVPPCRPPFSSDKNHLQP